MIYPDDWHAIERMHTYQSSVKDVCISQNIEKILESHGIKLIKCLGVGNFGQVSSHLISLK
jgi:hypothetical protein